MVSEQDATPGERGRATPTADVREGLARLTAGLADGSVGPLLARHEIDLLVLFGSAKMGGARPSADLDIAVGHAGGLDVLSLIADLYDVTGLEALDVVDLNRAGIITKGEVYATGRPLFQSPRGIFAERAAEALTMLWDTAWLRRVQLESLAGRSPA